MAKRWILDTETKGTGANVVPLDEVARRPEPKGALYVPPKRKPAEAPPRRPKVPLTFKVLEVTTKAVLGEGLDTRATVELLRGVHSVVDVRLYVWQPNFEDWRMLTLSETNALWGFR
ncbi:MAG: hypothetical protein ABI950_07870 [Solirubrobacteraceae bacterium]